MNGSPDGCRRLPRRGRITTRVRNFLSLLARITLVVYYKAFPHSLAYNFIPVAPTQLHCRDAINLAHIPREHALRTCIVTCHTPTYCTFARPCHTHTHTHTHTHNTHTHNTHNTHTHTHTHTGLVPLAVTLGSYFSHFFTKRTCAQMYTPVCIHTHTHTHTHTQTGLVPLAVTLGSYFSHFFNKTYMCTNVHTCVHTHTHTHTHTHRLGLYHLQ